MSIFSAYKKLHNSGLLGMNRRNISYVSRYNPRSLFPVVDNKLTTKKLALEHQVSVPDLIGVIEDQSEVSSLKKYLPTDKGFCIKPAKGSGGKGILVIIDVKEDMYVRPNGDLISLEELERHVSNILAGLFSLGGGIDSTIIESLIVVDPLLASYSFEGVPDIRVIVFQGIPVMAMMRLACAASHGKANLHQGAVGVGIDIATGKAINAVQNDELISLHPDTGQDLLQLEIPNWNSLLELACSCFDMCGLGYLGVDLVLDSKKGPTLLELNARPGLSIQIANGIGLVPRLKKVEQLTRPERMSTAERIAFAQTHFALER
ncbi:alpha-L-glutamate ligase-like protein [Teredinibacter sp. KSP-S5-2]|uniref:alpha-L-glutamate ligase-like protein n=1 Tax=Teredinibacter sp. KSP-S5-2 TaxID=3034506 RepID=UPI0029351B0B|nr:alpha-L-glutamate ligase-like protein [Teredinibacter sp. KSP-S5-2]WNO09500.1 alpha-L-glutamate ligase-like protein [Teredinibacter sp. KSP-S5-2]